MEARSLTELNRMANNPPRYSEGIGTPAPLVLYISRVPQSRDLILTTLKPQARNVTATDVKSALYLLHVGVSDSEPVRDENAHRSSEDGSLSRITIRRKPLPQSARPLSLDSLSGGSRRHQPFLPSDAAVFENTQGSRISAPSEVPERTALGLHTGIPTRKPLQPRPFPGTTTETSTSAQSMVMEGYSSPENRAEDAPRSHVKPMTAPPRDESVAIRNGNQAYPSRPRAVSQPHSRPLFPQSTAVTLRLIRQDPSSQLTWDVGYISLQQLTSTTGSVQHHPFDITIVASGYSAFRSSQAETFNRQAAMAYSDSIGTVAKKAFRAMKQSVSRDRSNSAASAASNEGGVFVIQDSIVTSGPRPKGMDPRGYTFLSPWGGQCAFETGASGSILTCFHTPAPSPGGIHSNSSGETRHSKPDASQVSSLHFNLPMSAEHAKAPKRVMGHFSNMFKGGSGSSSGSDDCKEPSCASLGAERAGGGLHGREAKLGKLEITAEGFKMLDLLVAANMGAWWTTWEKYCPVGA
ncbi:uncharacterized protein MAM_04460 [Metarhizium album ARSEF 1941]|uniref:Oxidoreductase-like protein n=1 Tax=Metarhizium album (strain ARSEF 1941) TaxID=1081103 RepID=A0A0B2WX43_METAS|nr:uncharacterized protein MAM_04460 [Metarhizium album ARSEF 1941]KHN97445.1 hypothetical protein MAM_04460 [Metarhizium album ARSEF 1941]